MKLLLDTCTFLWILADSDQLSDASRTLFEDPGNEVYLSSISTWEIAVKHTIGRLPLPDDPARWIPQQRARHGVLQLALDEAATLALPRLPPLHRDPFDRMLVCQAIVGGMTILTPDSAIRRYPVPSVW